MHLYIHIPFCRQACHYCDFHFSTNISGKAAMVEAIARELEMRQDYLQGRQLDTIYFGGGTPSMLDNRELDLLFNQIHKYFEVAKDAEITLEANPDDLTADKLRTLAKAGINRLSIGIQSFHEPHLRYLNRIHSGREAEVCVRNAQDAGITNLSVDLIYAIAAESHNILENDLDKTFSLDIPHISAYCLTIEPRTTFGNWLKNNRITPIDEEFAASQFELLVSALAAEGYEQYEISNFARNGKYSRHNSSYWKQEAYLGLGPGAHSYNGTMREYNVSHNGRYVQAITAGQVPATLEILSPEDQVNEYLLTGLRTKWGVEMGKLEQLSHGKFHALSAATLSSYTRKGWLTVENQQVYLTESGKLFADRIASDLFMTA
ncbi:radical SAM family heme chaperone HemW [Dyadobacter sandarakinus]|uniref:Heme chaperone HemW n=1 Tax=Dyadobacter sandarakinus TaxID=2747268 RepID=A0ABX7ICV1_9BACT|nr:radical SAM family heme chaperone HemW [Dyadobacter sandarakinus]QRR03949.1 radical SAM family heme chaperone HemW [Dyadobacter sandarakinus]